MRSQHNMYPNIGTISSHRGRPGSTMFVLLLIFATAVMLAYSLTPGVPGNKLINKTAPTISSWPLSADNS